MINIPRSPAVDRVMTVHNGIAHVVEVYGKQLTELSAENHALRAELMAQRQAQENALKDKDETILQQKQHIAELEDRLQKHSLRELASFEACG